MQPNSMCICLMFRRIISIKSSRNRGDQLSGGVDGLAVDGWTLQELIAPSSVKFFCSNRRRLGDNKSLECLLHEITAIAVLAWTSECHEQKGVRSSVKKTRPILYSEFWTSLCRRYMARVRRMLSIDFGIRLRSARRNISLTKKLMTRRLLQSLINE